MSVWIDRRDLRARLWDRLWDRSLIVIGPRRVGKSWLLRDMAERAPSRAQMVVVDLQGLETLQGMVSASRAPSRTLPTQLRGWPSGSRA